MSNIITYHEVCLRISKLIGTKFDLNKIYEAYQGYELNGVNEVVISKSSDNIYWDYATRINTFNASSIYFITDLNGIIKRIY